MEPIPLRDRISLAEETRYDYDKKETLIVFKASEILELMDLYYEARKVIEVTNQFPKLEQAVNKVNW